MILKKVNKNLFNLYFNIQYFIFKKNSSNKYNIYLANQPKKENSTFFSCTLLLHNPSSCNYHSFVVYEQHQISLILVFVHHVISNTNRTRCKEYSLNHRDAKVEYVGSDNYNSMVTEGLAGKSNFLLVFYWTLDDEFDVICDYKMKP